MGKAVEMPEKIFSYILAFAVQTHLSLGSQGAELVCGCQNHATEMTFFDLAGLALIQSVSHLRVIFTVNMVYFSNDECLLFFFPMVWLGQSTHRKPTVS